MSYTFNAETGEEEKEQNKPSLPSLTDAVIYCPKCGEMNSFKEDDIFDDLINHFCKKCGLKLNNYWDGYQTGDNTLVICDMCNALTFDKMEYCVACGAFQDVLARNRTEDLPKEIVKFQKKQLRKKRRAKQRNEISKFLSEVGDKIIRFLDCEPI